MGRWVGQLIVRNGQAMPLDIEITVENGITKFESVLPWAPGKKQEAEIFSVSDNGELIFGRRNRGSGLIIATAKIDAKGHLVGEEWLVGFTIPDDIPEEDKKQIDFFIKNPNTFDLVKK